MSPTIFIPYPRFLSLLLRAKEKKDQWQLSRKSRNRPVDFYQLFPEPGSYTLGWTFILLLTWSKYTTMIGWSSMIKLTFYQNFSRRPVDLSHIYTSKLTQKMYSGRNIEEQQKRFPEKRNKVRKEKTKKCRRPRQVIIKSNKIIIIVSSLGNNLSKASRLDPRNKSMSKYHKVLSQSQIADIANRKGNVCIRSKIWTFLIS